MTLARFLRVSPAIAGVYRPRHPERTVLYRALFHHFDRFLTEYESRFEIVFTIPERLRSAGAFLPKAGRP
jgi:hypothetical protein